MGWFCRCCSPPVICDHCNGGTEPEELTIVISGVTPTSADLDCTYCQDIHGTWVLPRTSKCGFRLNVEAFGTVTGYEDGGIVCRRANTIFSAYIYDGGGGVAYLGLRIFHWVSGGGCNAEYTFDYPISTSPVDCCESLTPAVTLTYRSFWTSFPPPSIPPCLQMCDYTTGTVTAECTA